MPMPFLLQQYQVIILPLLKKLFKKNLSIFIDIFYTTGEPILLHLLCCDPFAVHNHSCMGHASHLQQPRSVNNPGLLSSFPFVKLHEKSGDKLIVRKFKRLFLENQTILFILKKGELV
jgi:hypothetical protein